MTARNAALVFGIASQTHPMQEACAEHRGRQCGCCTPGMILAAIEIFQQQSRPTHEDIRTASAGNLCPCTGYMQIVAPIQAAVKAMEPPS